VTLIYPGDRLSTRMSKDALRELGLDIKDLIEGMERENAPLLKAMAIWWNWYEAKPRMKEKNFPFKGAANVVVPLIGITCDALMSRSLAQATAAAPTYWTTRTENEERTEVAQNMARYINWQADGNDFSIKHVLQEMFLETYVTGRGVCAINYRRDVRPVFFGRTPIGGTATVQRQPVEFSVRKHEWTWVQLREMAKLDDAWNEDAVREVRKFPGSDGDEASHVQRTRDDLDLRDRDGLENQVHDVREVWVDWSMLRSRFEVPGEEEWGGSQVPLVAHIHTQTGTILRLVGAPYLLPYKPFVDFKFRSGRGVAKRLEMLQSIQTTIWNQALDARTRANAVWAKTRNARHTKTPIDPAKPILVDDMAELEPFVLPSSPQQDLPLLVAAQTMSERWMGASDPLLGRDTRSGGHPAPATSTLALLEQVNVMSAGTDVIIQEEMSRIGEAVAISSSRSSGPRTP
jgi:hypothetical protein